MRTLCVIFGAVLLLFSGICIIHYQGDIRGAKFEKAPSLNNVLNLLTSDKDGFSVTYSVEPRTLID
ncbi:MAG: hypothetical protein P1U89_03555 [Verrucomicrobiales bacterium]|nr:hypothetical protein [Verrucomicrobiales bacterium]